jgi:hypothetical protein
MMFLSVHYCVDAEDILRMPDPFAPSTSRTVASSTAASTASSPITVDLSAMLPASIQHLRQRHIHTIPRHLRSLDLTILHHQI